MTAALLTAAMVVGLTIYAIKTETDFTMMGGMLFVLSLVLMAATLIGIFIKIK
jgi:FtsH-binding integral membrane protein